MKATFRAFLSDPIQILMLIIDISIRYADVAAGFLTLERQDRRVESREGEG